mgnify:CR=1 FL=1
MSEPSPIPLASSEIVAAILARPAAHIHLIGIGGAGLSAIAVVLLARGHRVTGSDLARTSATASLEAAGARIFYGHAAGQADGADLVLISSAVRAENPELRAAVAAGIPVVKRAQLLGPLMAGRLGVAVAGTHGKTTTTAMIATTLWAAGRDPDFIVGGVIAGVERSARAGRGGVFVIEADEYDRMFLGLTPQIAVVTNVEWDHVDCYPTPADFQAAFAAFVDRLPPAGCLIACADDRGACALARDRQQRGLPAVTYGLAAEATWQARALRSNNQGGFDFEAWQGGRRAVEMSLRVPGRHNVLNALATLAASACLEVQPEIVAANLKDFVGVRRRFEVKGIECDIIVVDDYAHHPSEVQATLAAARQRYPERIVWALFQPHTFSRTRALLDQFAGCFADADHVLITDIYAAREDTAAAVHAAQIAELAASRHPDVRYVGGLEAATAVLLAEVRPGAVVLTLGAGDGYRVGEAVLAALRGHDACA